MTKVSVFKDQSNEETSRCLFCISASKKTMRMRDSIMETLENIVFARFRVRYGQKMNRYIGFTSSMTIRGDGRCKLTVAPSGHAPQPLWQLHLQRNA